VPPSFSARLMNNWHQHTQGYKSAKEYVEKFDEFLIRCSTFHRKDEAQKFARFRVDVRDDRRTERLARGVNKLEAAYALVQDLRSLLKVMIIEPQCLDLPHFLNPLG